MEEFKELLLQALTDLNQDNNVNITTQLVTKHNNVQKTGIIIRKDGSNIGCTLYVEDYYRKYESGYSVESIASEIMARCYADTNSQNDSFLTSVINKIRDYDYIKEKIQVFLLNLEGNSSYLEDKVYYPYLKHGDDYELAICLAIDVPLFDGECGRITVTRQLREQWIVSDDDLLSQAMSNTRNNNGITFQNLLDVIMDFLKEKDFFSSQMNPPEYPAYVLTNKSRNFGAAALLFTDEIKSFAESVGMDLFVIPSSIHEAILIQDDGIVDARHIQAMIQEVNQTEVSPSDVLCNRLLYFSRESGELSVYDFDENDSE